MDKKKKIIIIVCAALVAVGAVIGGVLIAKKSGNKNTSSTASSVSGSVETSEETSEITDVSVESTSGTVTTTLNKISENAPDSEKIVGKWACTKDIADDLNEAFEINFFKKAVLTTNFVFNEKGEFAINYEREGLNKIRKEFIDNYLKYTIVQGKKNNAAYSGMTDEQVLAAMEETSGQKYSDFYGKMFDEVLNSQTFKGTYILKGGKIAYVLEDDKDPADNTFSSYTFKDVNTLIINGDTLKRVG